MVMNGETTKKNGWYRDNDDLNQETWRFRCFYRVINGDSQFLYGAYILVINYRW